VAVQQRCSRSPRPRWTSGFAAVADRHNLDDRPNREQSSMNT
jgi:hypothetical protein